MLFKQSRERVGTGELNRLVGRALEQQPPPTHKNRRPKVYYATQTDIQPPTVVLKCNDPVGFTATYRRYLLRILRENLNFGEVPIRLLFDRRSSGEEPASGEA
jgi:GTP-binding protein